MRERWTLALPYAVVAVILVVVGWRATHRDEMAVPEDGSSGLLQMAVGEAAAASMFAAHLDPVCHMEVGDNLTARYAGRRWAFCSSHCRDRFVAHPEAYVVQDCPVCRAEGTSARPAAEGDAPRATWHGQTFRFCGPEHRDAFLAAPARYLSHRMAGLPGWLYYGSIAVILVLSFGVFEVVAARRRAGGPEEPRPRVDLLARPWLRRLAASARARFVARIAVVGLFVLVIVAGLFGNQLPNKNLAPLLTWTVWWGGLIWFVAYFGKLWCTVCPWDAIAEWSEGLRLWGKRHARLGLGLAWPRAWRNLWPATILFVGLTWIELGFGVTMNPRVTAWLGLAILGLAFASIFVFDRKSFCRYGCLVGRVSGLYAMFAPVEMRARDREVCRSCRTQDCYRGNERGDGCPTFQYPARMDSSTYCTLCLECLRTCPHENMTLRLRPWGEDLRSLRRPRSDEAYLALIMLTLTVLHGLTMTAVWGQWVSRLETWLGSGPTVAFTVGMLVVMLGPIAVYAGLVALSQRLGGNRLSYREYFLRYAYALLPIALFYHLAHNSEHLLMEGQKVVALLSDPLGHEWNLLGTTTWTLRPLTDLGTLWFLQVFFVGIGHVYSLWMARRTAGQLFDGSRAALRSQVPMLVAMILFSLLSLWLLKQPMEMRLSAM